MADREEMVAGDDGWCEWRHPLPGFIMECCDCGLLHEMEVAIAPANSPDDVTNEGETAKGVVIFRMRRS